MPICGRVLSKPGYSTFSEACRTRTPLVSITREDFAEAPILIDAVQHYIPHQILAPADFFQGNWDFLHQPLQSPKQVNPVIEDGNRTIAEAVLNFWQ
jgi:hypothetical protein